MSTVIDTLERAQLRRVPRFRPGDRVKVHFQVIEGTRRRTQVFEGVVIKRQGEGVRETFTVRKQSFGVGVERTFPVHSPKIEKIEVAARGDVRRAKLYYLRGRVGKRARVRERRYTGPEEVVEARPAARPGGRGRRGRGRRGPRRAPSTRRRSKRPEAEAAAAEAVRGRRGAPPPVSESSTAVGAVAARRRRRRQPSGSLLELVLIVAVALGLALAIQAFLVKPYRIPSESMVPTLQVGQRVLVNRIGARFSAPDVGDVVVFHPPEGAEQDNMCGGGQPPAGQVCDKPTAHARRRQLHQARRRRPGDKLSIQDGHVDPERQAAGGDVRACPVAAARAATSRDGHGSGRPLLHDGRQPWQLRRQPVLGPVPRKWIIGQAFATYWPPKRIGLL